MKWTRLVGLLALALGTSGCATSAQRDHFGLPGERSTANLRTTRTVAPQQVHQTVPALAEGPANPLLATTPSRFDRFRLSHYLTPLGRSPATPAAGLGRANAPSAVTPLIEVAARGSGTMVPEPPRASWFGLRRTKTSATTTYLADARGEAGRSAVVPTHLPGVGSALADRSADRAVTTASVEAPAQAPTPATEPAEGNRPDSPASGEVPAEGVSGIVSARPLGDLNPDSSAATAEPLRGDQPVLAVAPITPPQAVTAPPQVVEVAAIAPVEPTAAPVEPTAAPVEPTAAPVEPTVAPSAVGDRADDQFPERLRGRPRLTSASPAVPSNRGVERPQAGPRPTLAARLGTSRRDSAAARPAAAVARTPNLADPHVRPTTRTTTESTPIASEPTTTTTARIGEAAATRAPISAAADSKRDGSGDPATVRAVPSLADPGRSLGLPELVLPASYAKHHAGGARSSGQSLPPSPGPVLASPQVEPTPQVAPSSQAQTHPGSGGVVATATKAKTKFCLFLRKCFLLKKAAR